MHAGQWTCMGEIKALTAGGAGKLLENALRGDACERDFRATRTTGTTADQITGMYLGT